MFKRYYSSNYSQCCSLNHPRPAGHPLHSCRGQGFPDFRPLPFNPISSTSGSHRRGRIFLNLMTLSSHGKAGDSVLWAGLIHRTAFVPLPFWRLVAAPTVRGVLPHKTSAARWFHFPPGGAMAREFFTDFPVQLFPISLLYYSDKWRSIIPKA